MWYVRQHHVDLAVVHAVFRGNDNGHEQHRERVRPVALDLRTRLVRVRVWLEQRLDGLGMQIRRPRLAQLVLGRVQEVDPLRLGVHEQDRTYSK